MKPKAFVKRAHLLEQKYSYIELPYSSNGDLFGLIEQKDGLAENTARYFSHQIIKAVSYMHKLNVVH